MASTIGKVRAVFTASTSGLTAGVNQASASMKRLQRDVGSLKGGLSTLTAISGAQLFGSIASGALSYARSLTSMAQASMDAIGNQRDLAARLGLTYGELSGLTLAGSQVGVSMDQIGGAVQRAEIAFTKAAGGSKTAIDAFGRIGLSVEQLNGMSASERFQAIAQAISELPSPAERAAAAVGLFGRAGGALLPMFEQGAAGIQAATAEADRFGLALTGVQANNVDAMGDAFTNAQKAVKGVIDQIVAYLAPAVTSVTEAFTTLISGVGGKNIGAAIGDGILAGARFLAQVADWFLANMRPIWEYASQVGGQWNAVWEFGSRVASFFAGIGDSLQAAFGILILGITGPVEGLIFAAQQIGQTLGFDTSGLDQAVEAMDAFNVTIADGITENVNAAAENFNRAIFGDDEANKAGEAVAGPITQAFDAARQQALDAMNAVDQAQKQTLEIQAPAGVAEAVKSAIQGIDSRTTEGMKEYFRILRGDGGDNIPSQQLRQLERIGDAVEEDGIELDTFELAPAAGV
jgi:hypothetical protein